MTRHELIILSAGVREEIRNIIMEFARVNIGIPKQDYIDVVDIILSYLVAQFTFGNSTSNIGLEEPLQYIDHVCANAKSLFKNAVDGMEKIKNNE